VARDRQRAKQRKARRGQNPGPALSQPTRADLPGELEHASGEVDEFDAALVAGADGVPEPDLPLTEPPSERDAFGVEHPESLDEEAFEELEDDIERTATGRVVPRPSAAPGVATRRGPGRFAAFLRASWAELQRVQWPDRRQVGQATAVVIGFVIVAGIYLGVADWIAGKVVDAIL
jgi:preprotein translocase subunit SecE